MGRRSLVGVVAALFTFLGVPIERFAAAATNNNKDGGRGCGSSCLARGLSVVAKLVDAIDLVIDVTFVRELAIGGHAGWATLMATTMVVAHVLSCLYDGVIREARERHGYGLNFMYYFGTAECIVFLFEDTTTIYLFAEVEGAFDRDSVSDWLNLVSSLASAAVVSFFILLGGARLIVRGQSTDWVPRLGITRVAEGLSRRFGLPLDGMMNTLIFVKCVWVALVIGYFAFLVFYYVLHNERLQGAMAEATTVVYCSAIMLGLALSLRLPTKKKAVAVDDGGEGDDGPDDSEQGIDMPLTSTAPREIV